MIIEVSLIHEITSLFISFAENLFYFYSAEWRVDSTRKKEKPRCFSIKTEILKSEDSKCMKMDKRPRRTKVRKKNQVLAITRDKRANCPRKAMNLGRAHAWRPWNVEIGKMQTKMKIFFKSTLRVTTLRKKGTIVLNFLEVATLPFTKLTSFSSISSPRISMHSNEWEEVGWVSGIFNCIVSKVHAK